MRKWVKGSGTPAPLRPPHPHLIQDPIRQQQGDKGRVPALRVSECVRKASRASVSSLLFLAQRSERDVGESLPFISGEELVDSIIQAFYILTDFLLMVEIRVLKSSAILGDLSVSPNSSITFCFMDFEALLLGT